MGCDIHCFVEQRNDEGKWEQIGDFVSAMYNPESDYFGGDDYKNADSPIDNRSYLLFGILAGVRNEKVPPISLPRGLPEDVSKAIEEDHSAWGCDAHSSSYLTVQELTEYDWEQSIRCRGVVSKEQFKEYIKRGVPSTWSNCVFERDNLVVTTNERMMMGVKGTIPFKEGLEYYTDIEWNESLGDYTQNFTGRSLPQLKDRCKEEDYSDVRIVFWFDN